MRPLLLILALAGCCCALEDPAAHLDQMERDYQAAREAYTKAWLKAVDLSPVPVPELAKDPRQSEADRVRRLNDINLKLLNMRQQRGDALPLEERTLAGGMFTQVREWAGVVSEAAEARVSAPAAEAPKEVAKPPHHEPTAVFVNRKD